MITAILLFPVMGPAWALVSLVERLREEAAASLDDEARSFNELTELTMRRSAGTLTDAEFVEQETALLARLNVIREQREQLESALADEELTADDFADEEVDELVEEEVEC